MFLKSSNTAPVPLSAALFIMLLRYKKWIVLFRDYAPCLKYDIVVYTCFECMEHFLPSLKRNIWNMVVFHQQ